MKKFELEKELSKIQNKKQINKRKSNPNLLVIAGICLLSLIAYSSVSFAIKTTSSSSDKYTIKVKINNGYESLYVKEVPAGSFSDKIDSKFQIAQIECTKGSLNYDINTRTIYEDNIKEDTECTLTFLSNEEKSEINIDELKQIHDNYGESYYFNSDATNNYFMINYLLFRIVRINGDGSFRLVLDSSIEDIQYGNENYESSNIYNYLNTWFNNNLSNVDYIVKNDYDNNIYNSLGTEFNNGLINLNGYYVNKVGLLSVNEIININGSNKISSKSYLNGNYFTMNLSDDKSVWVVKNDGTVSTASRTNLFGVRPVINVMVDKLAGHGTFDDPYTVREE